MYENQKVDIINPVIKEVKIEYISNKAPIDKGLLTIKNIILIIIKVDIKIIIISESSLIKILILGINDKEVLFFWSFKSNTYFWFTRPMFLINY